MAGHVVDYRTHKALSGIELTVLSKTVKTDVDGAFRFEGLPAKGAQIMTAHLAGNPTYGWSGDTQMIVHGGDTNIELKLRDAACRPLVVGDRIPPLNMNHWINSRPLTLASLKGKIVLLDFWFIACPPCRKALPSLVALHKKLGDQIVMIGVHNKDMDAKTLASFAKANNMTYPLAIDLGGLSGEFTDRFVTSGFPTLVIIGPDGRIANMPESVADAEAKIEELLAAK